MGKKIVSIALATYNGEIFLVEQLESIYCQTYNNFEVIVVDDASSDNTISILEEYKIKYGLEYFVNEKNLGVTKTFEKAILLCSGEFIVLSDQDDIWKSNKISILLKNIGNSSLIYSNAEIIDEKGYSKGRTAKDCYHLFSLDSSDKNFYKYIVLNSFILGCTMMFKADLLNGIKIFKTERNHDWCIAYLAHQNKGITYIDEKLISYRHHINNYSRSNNSLPISKVILRYFSRKVVREGSKQVLEQKKIIEYIMINNIYSSKQQILFLKNILRYTESYLFTKIHFRAFFIAIRYNRYLISNLGLNKKFIFLISKLIG